MGIANWFRIEMHTKSAIPWCTLPSMPPLLIDTLWMTRYRCEARADAFCILPDRIVCLVQPGNETIDAFVASFKAASVRDAQLIAGLLMHDQRLCRGWQRDTMIESVPPDRLGDAAAQIESLPVLFALVERAEDWQWSSRWYGRSDNKKTLSD